MALTPSRHRTVGSLRSPLHLSYRPPRATPGSGTGGGPRLTAKASRERQPKIDQHVPQGQFARVLLPGVIRRLNLVLVDETRHSLARHLRLSPQFSTEPSTANRRCPP